MLTQTTTSDHEHEWHPSEDTPVIEDGAAIFTEECNFVEITESTVSEKHDEIFHGEGESCDATQHTQFEETTLTRKRDDEPNVTYLLNPDAIPENRGTERLRQHLVAVATNGEITTADPCEETGMVTVETRDWKITYKPVTS